MLRSLILKKLDKVEIQLGGSMDYARHIVRVSLRAFFKFVKIMPIAQYRRSLPHDALYVARIVATRDEDCGGCVQIEVNLARQAGVSVEVLQAVLDGQPVRLSPELALVYEFAEGVVTASGREEELREPVRKRYGEEGLVEFSLAMASSRFFPIVKRTVGYAKSCREVQIEVPGRAGVRV